MLVSGYRHIQEENAKLKEENARLLRMLFGSTSERMEHGKIDIEVAEVPPPAPASKDNPTDEKATRTRRLRVHYTKVVEETLLPEEVEANPQAYSILPESAMKVSRRVVYHPAHLELRITKRPGFVFKGKRGKDGMYAPVYAPAPTSILPGSNVDASLVAHLLYGKFMLHLPLNRQLKEFERLGLEGMSEGVACNWVRAGADTMEPLWHTLHEQQMAEPVLQVDETPIRCLKADVTKGTLWAMNNPQNDRCLYYWETSRGKAVLDTLLREGMEETGKAYGGAIVTDGYEAYASWLREQPEEERPAWQSCWAHVRRKFVEGTRNSGDPAWCKHVVKLIAHLYRVEKELRESKAPPEEILARRRSESRPCVDKIFSLLEQRANNLTNPPLNNLRKAIDYAMARREHLVTWLDNPAVPIDNNGVERAIRPIAVGRQGYLFIGAPHAGKRAAILYTLMQECKRVGVDARAWMTEALRRLPGYKGDYRDLLPGVLPLPGTATIGETQI